MIHVKYAFAPDRAWVGLSPLEIARQAGQLDAEINQALADESAMPRGGILPLANQPDDDDDDDDKDNGEPEIESVLGKLRGSIMIVESAATAAAGGYQEAPKGDWLVNRVGAAFQQPLVALRRDADSFDTWLMRCSNRISERARDGSGAQGIIQAHAVWNFTAAWRDSC